VALAAWAPESHAGEPSPAATTRTYAVRSAIGRETVNASRTPEVAMFVLWHDRRTGATLQLGLSSDGFADRHFHSAGGVSGIWLGVVPQPPQSLGALAAPAAVATPDADADALLQRWSGVSADGAPAMVGVLAPTTEAARIADACGRRCVAAIRPGLIVLGIGLPSGAVEASADALRSPGAPAEVELLRLGARAREWWPSSMPVRSAVYARRGQKDAVTPELLRVDVDPRGRANDRLSLLHLRHLGDVELPARIGAAEHAANGGDPAEARRHLRAAVEAGRAALTIEPREALWRADLALAMAMLDPRDDRAIVEIEQAVAHHRRRADVRLRAAQILRLRGEDELAQRQIGEALRLAPDDAAVQAAARAAQLP